MPPESKMHHQHKMNTESLKDESARKLYKNWQQMIFVKYKITDNDEVELHGIK